MIKLMIAILFLNIACNTPKDTDFCHYSIKFKNKTDKVFFIDSSSDTILQSYMDPRPYYENTHVLPYAGNNNIEIGSIYFIRNGRPMCIEDLYRPDEKLYVFAYDSTILGDKEWNEIRKNYLVTKRYDLTIKDLENMNWKITYDGN